MNLTATEVIDYQKFLKKLLLNLVEVQNARKKLDNIFYSSPATDELRKKYNREQENRTMDLIGGAIALTSLMDVMTSAGYDFEISLINRGS